MYITRLFVAAVALFALGQAPAPLPTQVLHDVVKARITLSAKTPDEIAETLSPVVAQARTTDLSAQEEVALGLAWFFAFEGGKARPLLQRHQDRDDRLGRVSRQALLQMAFAGARYDEVRTGPEAVALMTKHRDALRARVAVANRAVPTAQTPFLTTLPHRAGVMHVDPFNDGLLEDDPAMTADALLLERAIRQIQFFEAGRPR